MTVIRYHSNYQFSHALYRCDKTAFLWALASTGSTLLSQVVLTLRFAISLALNDSALIAAERNRIYAVTGKNRRITACLGVVTISQFALGLYSTIFSAMGGESLNRRCPQPLPTSRLQHNKSYRSHLTPIGYALPCDVCPWKSGLPPYHWHMVRDHPCLSYCRRYHHDHPTDLLAFLVIVYLVLRSHLYRVPVPSLLRTIAQDSTHYFLIIFTSHLVFELTLLLGRVRISP